MTSNVDTTLAADARRKKTAAIDDMDGGYLEGIKNLPSKKGIDEKVMTKTKLPSLIKSNKSEMFKIKPEQLLFIAKPPRFT